MTLDPVFRSRAAVREIQEAGLLDRMSGSLAEHRAAVRWVHERMPEVLDRRFLEPAAPEADGAGPAGPAELDFLQSHFFLVLFHSVFACLGPGPERLRLYARLNFCIKGIVTAGDNLFDDEAKRLLPLRIEHGGSRFESILQLLCFSRLVHLACEQAAAAGDLTGEQARDLHRGLLDRLAEIGSLEGSEEGGVEELLPVEEMIEKVHRVRGGALFSLAFIAPAVIEQGEARARFARAEAAIRRLGTAFQIVDDVTDLEIDLARRSHNIVAAVAVQQGSDASRALILDARRGKRPERAALEQVLDEAAPVVLGRARDEARRAFEELAALGYWFPPERSAALVHAIVGVEGAERMERMARRSAS
jgi:hypothetical protein